MKFVENKIVLDKSIETEERYVTRNEKARNSIFRAFATVGAGFASLINTAATVENLQYFDEGGPAVGPFITAAVTAAVTYSGLKLAQHVSKPLNKGLVILATAGASLWMHEGTKHCVGVTSNQHKEIMEHSKTIGQNNVTKKNTEVMHGTSGPSLF